MTADDPDTNLKSEKSSLTGLGEFGLIGLIRRAAQTDDPRIIESIGDDAAVFSAGDKTLVTVDLLVEDVHFLVAKTTPHLLGRKALAVNLSDIAAMGGTPKFTVLGLASPRDFPLNYLEAMVAGFLEKAGEYGVSLVGGDVCRSDKLMLSVTVIGEADPPAPVYRSGAGIGDLVFVTGTVGDSALGLMRLIEMDGPLTDEVIASDPLAGPIGAHLDPPARVEAGKALAPVATAMLDLSDGLVSDLTHILEESGVPGAEIGTDKIPVSEVFRRHFDTGGHLSGKALQAAVTGGEDYELLFTAPASSRERIARIAEKTGLAIAEVGETVSRPGIEFIGAGGSPLPPPTPLFEHFGKEGT